MALLEEKKKKFLTAKQPETYSIYAPGTPTVKAQDKMNAATGRVFNSAATYADDMLGGKGVKAMSAPFAQAGNKLAEDFSARSAQAAGVENRQRSMSSPDPQKFGLARDILNTRPNALPLVGSNASLTPAPAKQQLSQPVLPTQVSSPGGNITASFTGADRTIKSNLQGIDQMLANGTVPPADQAQRIKGIREQAGFLRGGTDKRDFGPDGKYLINPSGVQQVGNMDVQFDKSVPSAARQAFLANPVKPTGQMDRFAAQQAADKARYDETTQDLLWKKDPKRQQALLDAGIEKNKLALDTENSRVQNRQLGVATQGQEMQNKQTQTEIDQQNEYLNPEIKPERKKQLESLWMAKAGKTGKQGSWQTIEEPILDANGFAIEGTKKTPVFVDENGTATPLTDMMKGNKAQTTPQTALDYLKKNPQEAENFKKKYGYLPQ